MAQTDGNAVRSEYERNFRTETSRLASMANKRIKRLANSEWSDSPAYQKWVKEGSVSFGNIRYMDFNQVKAERARIEQYLDYKTSTITGTKNVLKDIAKNTGLEYSTDVEFRNQTRNFFDLASKVNQYMKVGGFYAYQYHDIWDSIIEYEDFMGEYDSSILNDNYIPSLIEELAEMTDNNIRKQNDQLGNFDFFGDDGWGFIK